MWNWIKVKPIKKKNDPLTSICSYVFASYLSSNLFKTHHFTDKNLTRISEEAKEMDTQSFSTNAFDNDLQKFVCTSRKQFKTLGFFKRHLENILNWVFRDNEMRIQLLTFLVKVNRQSYLLPRIFYEKCFVAQGYVWCIFYMWRTYCSGSKTYKKIVVMEIFGLCYSPSFTNITCNIMLVPQVCCVCVYVGGGGGN